MARDEFGELVGQIALLSVAGDEDNFEMLSQAAKQFSDEDFRPSLLHERIFEGEGDFHWAKCGWGRDAAGFDSVPNPIGVACL